MSEVEIYKRIAENEKPTKRELQKRIQKAINKMQYIKALGFDYDGFNNIDDLKKLIDELVNIANDSVDILIGEDNE